MSRILAFLTAVIVLLGSGMMYNSLARDSDELEAAASRVANVPLKIGPWQGKPTPETEEEAHSFERTGAKSHFTRTYVHERSGLSVLVILMCGRTGKMGVHTPDVCYGGAGYELMEQPRACQIKNEQGADIAEFWMGQFTKKLRAPANLRLYWAWNGGEKWVAATAPRWQYSGGPFLYKLYVARDLNQSPAAPAATEPALEFLRQFVPKLNAALFP